MHKTIKSISLTLFLSIVSALAETPSHQVIFSPNIEGRDPDNLGLLIRELVEIDLSNHDKITLLDRTHLTTTLDETVTREIDKGQLDSQLSLSGAKFAVYSKIIPTKELALLTYKVVNLSTSQYETVSIEHKEGTPVMATAEKAAQKIINKIINVSATKKELKNDTSVWELPASLKKPNVSIYIPEESVAKKSIDPAGEKKLTEILLKKNVTVIGLTPHGAGTSLEINGIIKTNYNKGLFQEARNKNVDVLIIGMATSHTATNIGKYSIAKARVELNAYDTKTSKVLATSSSYGKALDLSSFVSEKKAIEDATSRLSKKFITEFIESWNK